MKEWKKNCFLHILKKQNKTQKTKTTKQKQKRTTRGNVNQNKDTWSMASDDHWTACQINGK